MRLRAIVLAGLALAAGLHVPAATAATTVTLAGTTVISGSGAVSTDVRVPRDVTLHTPFGGSPDIAVSGGGSLAAFVLLGTGSHNAGYAVAGVAARLGGDVARVLMPVPRWPALGGESFPELKTYGATTPLPAGTYRLYVVSAEPVTFTLRLPDVAGRVAVRPARRAAGGVVLPAMVTATATTYAASVTHGLQGYGFAVHALLASVTADAAYEIVMCHGPHGEDVPLAGQPACPNGDEHVFEDHRVPEVTARTAAFVKAFNGLPGGLHDLSAVYGNEGVVTAMSYATLWVTY